VAREFKVHPVLLSRWHSQYHRQEGVTNEMAEPTAEKRIVELERMVGRLTMENALLKKAVQRLQKKDEAG
jgi:transposase-like protein